MQSRIEATGIDSQQIFLCYAKEDKARVEEIYLAMRSAGLRPWMDKPPRPYGLEGIKAGSPWQTEIRKTIQRSSYFLAFLSRVSVEKKGFVQREYRYALKQMEEIPSGRIFLIPVLLEKNCPVPEVESTGGTNFNDLQWFDLEGDGLDALIQFLQNEVSASKHRNGIRREMTAGSVSEFADAIGSDRILNLEEQRYLLSPEHLEGKLPDNVSLEKVFEGWQVNISDVHNMTIRGIRAEKTHIIVRPTHAFVLSFNNCQNITLENLTMAHNPPGGCRGGVGQNFNILSCHLYGSGTVGLDFQHVDGFVIKDSELSNCTHGILQARGLRNALFDKVMFHHNERFFGFKIERSKDVRFENCELTDNSFPDSILFDLDGDSSAVWRAGSIKRNRAKGLYAYPVNLKIENADVRANTFDIDG